METLHKGATRELAEFVADLDFRDLPDEVLLASQTALLDHLAAALHGANQPWTEIVREQALSNASGGRSVAYGIAEAVPAAAAALINGTAAHGFELDDIYLPGIVHAGSVVIPAALAAVADVDVRNGELLASIVAGYEVLGRVAAALGHWNNSRGFHTTGVIGPLGSSTSCAKLNHLPPDLIGHAWGIAASFGGGIKAFQHGGGMVKRVHAGRAAEAGVLAVDLARRGLTGPVGVLETARGVLDVYGGRSDGQEMVTKALGERYAVENVYFKPYPSCTANHTAILAAKNLVARHNIEPRMVSSVIVGTSQRGIEQNSITDLKDTLSAQYSLEYAVAVALRSEAEDPTSFLPDQFSDTKRLELMNQVQLILDAEAESLYPGKMAARITINTHDGDTYREWAPDLPAKTDTQSVWLAVRRKAILLLGNSIGTQRTHKLIDAIENMDLEESFGGVANLLRGV